MLPLSRPVSPEEYEAIARRIAGDIGIDMCDDTTYEPHRLMYWASASSDGEFRYEVQDGPWLGRRRAAREVRRLERPDSVACLKQEVRHDSASR